MGRRWESIEQLDAYGSQRALGYAIDPVENVTRDAEGSVDHVELYVEVTKAAGDLGALSDPLPTVGYADLERVLLLFQVADRPIDPHSLWLRWFLALRSCGGCRRVAGGSTERGTGALRISGSYTSRAPGTPVETNATRMCALLVGLPEIAVLGVGDRPDRPLRVHVETVVEVEGCTGRGTKAWVKDRRPVALVDLPAFGRPAVLVWHKRRWCCPDPH